MRGGEATYDEAKGIVWISYWDIMNMMKKFRDEKGFCGNYADWCW